MAVSERDQASFATMTLEQLDMYEKTMESYDGADKSEYMALVEQRRAAIAAEEDALEAERAARIYDLAKLDPYKKIPRDESQFITDMTANPPFFGLFGKDKWKASFYNAPLVYAAVVQANEALWDPGDEEDLPAVFVFATDKAHCYNIDWLVDMANKISELKHSCDVPSDCAELIKTLRDSQSYFCFKVGSSIAGNAEAWCATYSLEKQAMLPYKALPANGVVPFLLKEQPEHDAFVQFQMIPGKYYQ